MGQLFRGHLDAEHPDRHLPDHGHRMGDIQRECGLAHAGPAGEHQEIRPLHSTGQAIEIDEPGGDSGDLALVRVDMVELLVDIGENARQRLEVSGDAGPGDVE